MFRPKCQQENFPNWSPNSLIAKEFKGKYILSCYYLSEVFSRFDIARIVEIIILFLAMKPPNSFTAELPRPFCRHV